MLLLRHLLMMPMETSRGVLGEGGRQQLGDALDRFLSAARQIERLLPLRPVTQPRPRTTDQLPVVPPEARIEGEIGVEQVGLEEERLYHEQPGEGFPDNRRFLG